MTRWGASRANRRRVDAPRFSRRICISTESLRGSAKGLEIKPDDWGSFRYAHQLSVLDLMADDWEERLRLALDLDPASAE